MKKIITLASVLLSLAASAQEFSIKTIELNAQQVILYYDLIDTARSRTYTVHLFSSRDNFLAPLSKVSGDMGIEVKPGVNKRIVWNAQEELGSTFDGDVELEVRGRMYVPFIRFAGFEKVTTIKRKTNFLIKWTGGSRQNILNFQLYRKGEKEDKLVHVFPNVANAFEYNAILPGNVPPGDGYYFVIADTKNKDLMIRTNSFKVTRKIPQVWKALGVALVGSGIYLLTQGGGGEDLPAVSEAPNILPTER